MTREKGSWLEGWSGFWIGVAIAVLIAVTSQPSEASTPANITNTVGVCDPNFPQRCIAPAADGSLVVSGSVTAGAVLGATGVSTTSAIYTAATALGDGTTSLSTQNTPGSNSSAGIVSASTLGGSSITKGTPGNLYALNAVAPASAGFVQVFNLAAVPADASTNQPVWCLPLGANVGLDKVFNPPLVGTVGISVVYSSSTCGAALVKVNAVYLQFMTK